MEVLSDKNLNEILKIFSVELSNRIDEYVSTTHAEATDEVKAIAIIALIDSY